MILAATLASEPLCVALGVLAPDFKESFASPPGPETWGTYFTPIGAHFSYIVYEVCRAFSTHIGAYFLLGGLRDRWYVLKSEANRSCLSRAVMNVAFLAACGYRGLAMWRGWYADAGWSSYSEAAAHVHQALTETCTKGRRSPCGYLPFVPPTPHARLYDYDASFQRMAVVMFGFQAKNLADTLYYDDGPIFIVHHLVTMTVALFALHPFSHLYGSFFFGVSEASTTILAVVALFDAEHGVPELERDYPTTRLAVGAVFIVSFVVVRCMLWPYLTYFYCRDGFAILEDDPQIHSRGLVQLFMGCLATLSVMQFIWLLEVLGRLWSELLAPGLVALGLKSPPPAWAGYEAKNK